MFINILLASDGSECAIKAAGVAATLAAKFGARLTIINVYQPFPTIGPYGEAVNVGLDERYITGLQEHAISHAGRAVEEAGVSYQGRREVGQPAAEIIRVAEAEGSDLIVMGSRGASGITLFLLGSTCDRVVHHAHCPVLIVK